MNKVVCEDIKATIALIGLLQVSVSLLELDPMQGYAPSARRLPREMNIVRNIMLKFEV